MYKVSLDTDFLLSDFECEEVEVQEEGLVVTMEDGTITFIPMARIRRVQVKEVKDEHI